MKKFTFLSILMILGFTLFTNNLLAAEVQVANLNELRQQTVGDGTIYHLTGEVILTHQHAQRNQKYIQDDTGAMLIDDNSGIITTSYNLYDGITGIKGTLTHFRNLIQFVPTEDPGAATTDDNLIEPMVITFDDLAPEHQAMLVRVNDVAFDGDYNNFAASASYNVIDPSGASILRTPGASTNLDYFGTPVPDDTRDIVFLVGQYDDDMQVFPRSLMDFYPDGLPSYDVTFVVIDEQDDPITDAAITFDGTTYAAGEYLFEGVEAGSYTYSVEKTGFYTRSGNVAVTSNDVTVTVILVAEDPNAVIAFPWTEGFEGEDFPPASWTHYALGTGGWQSTTVAENVHEGDKAVWHNFAPGEADSWLISPQIVLPEDENYLLKFFQKNNFMTDYGYSGVKISTGSGNPAQEEFVEIYEASATISNFSERIINLADYAGEVIYIAFVYQGDNAHQWFVDDVNIEEAPAAILVDNIAALRDQEAGGDLIFQVTGEVFITHQQLGYRNQMFVQDATGAIIIDDAAGIITTEFDNYDGIINLKGKLSDFQNMLQLVPEEDPGDANSTDNTIEPLEVTLADLSKDHEAMLVLVKGVSFANPDGVNFTHNVSYELTDASGEGVIRTPNSAELLDYFGTPLPTAPVDLIGVVTQRYEETRLLPRSLADFLEPTSIQDIQAAGFNMYPNPAVNQFTVIGETTIDYIRVFNMNGQVVLQKQVNDTNTNLDITSLTSGIYVVQVISGQNRLNYKLQVQ